MKIFRFDDISENTDLEKLYRMTNFLIENKLFDEIWYCISLFCHNPNISYHPREKEKTALELERVFPKIFNALSDYHCFFQVDKFFIRFEELKSKKSKYVKLLSHGLFHVDHRLLSKDLQELSIIVSCNFINTYFFIPPFNKYDINTEHICKEKNIQLVKFEDNWLHLKYNDYNKTHEKYYVHTFDITEEEFQKWFQK